MRTQSGITEIWDAIGQGEYGNDPTASRPRRVVDDAVEQVLSIPTEDGTGLEHFSRKPGGIWEPTRYVGQRP
jgi:hypothetical protein